MPEFSSVPLLKHTIQGEFANQTEGDTELLDVTIEVASLNLKALTNLQIKVKCKARDELEMIAQLQGYQIVLNDEQLDYEYTFRNGYEKYSRNGVIEDMILISLDFLKLYQGQATASCQLELLLAYDIRRDDVRCLFQMEPVPLTIDFDQFTPLSTPDGEQSHYVRKGMVIYYVSPYSRAYETRFKKTAIDLTTCQVLNRQYIKDHKSVLRDGRLLRGVSPQEFRVFNRLFAGSHEVVLTSYGNAKVEDPSTFEVLDDGNQYIHMDQSSGGYGAGYARDCRHVYFFCESTSTKHAVKVRSAKHPSTFRSIGRAYGIDDRNVYFEGRSIKNADPATFQLLGKHYAKDEQNVFFASRIIQGADVKTFAVKIIDQDGCEKVFGKDAYHFYEFGHVCDPP